MLPQAAGRLRPAPGTAKNVQKLRNSLQSTSHAAVQDARHGTDALATVSHARRMVRRASTQSNTQETT
jgi:hypothetical protein